MTEHAMKERDAFITSNDTMGTFLEINGIEFTDDENDYVLTTEILGAYNADLESENLMPVSGKKFVPELKRKAKVMGFIIDNKTKRLDGKVARILTGVKWNPEEQLDESNIF